MPRAEAKYVITADDQTKRGVRSAQRGLDRLKGGLVGFAATAGTAFVAARRGVDNLKGGLVGFALSSVGRLSTVAAAVTAIGSSVTAAGVAIQRTADRLHRLRRIGQDIGLVGAETAQLGFIAEAKDVSPEQLIGAIEQLQERILDAKQGGEEARRQFQLLGVTFKELEGKSPIAQLVAIQEALEGIQDANVRTGVISDLLGGGLGRLFAGEGIGGLAGRAQELGVTRDAAGRQSAASRFVQGFRELRAAAGARSAQAFQPVMRVIGALASRAGTIVAGGTPQTPNIMEDLQRRQLRELQQIRIEQRRSISGGAVYGD